MKQTIKHENISFEITPVYSASSMARGFKIIETNPAGRSYDFSGAIYTANGINQIMIQQSKCYGTQINTKLLIGE